MATLTVPKIKDFVHGPQRKYKEIHQLLSSSSSKTDDLHESSSSTYIHSLPSVPINGSSSSTQLQDLVDFSMLLRDNSSQDFMSKDFMSKDSMSKGSLEPFLEPLSSKSADYFSQLLERKEYLGKKIANTTHENDFTSMKSELKDFLHGHLKMESNVSSSMAMENEPSYYSFLKTT